MAGTHSGGKLAAQTNIKKYGLDFYAVQGAKGGKAPGKPKGFAYSAANGLDWHITAGSKGGSISKRPAGTSRRAINRRETV